jgi:hypothetical protein
MKFEDLVGHPALLDLDSPDVDSPLPTTIDLFRHAYHLIENAKKNNTHFSTSNVYNRVAEDVIQLYTNRSQPSASRQVIAR